MDYFREAQWFFDEDDRLTWYSEILRKSVVQPRIPRFGIMQQVCSNLTAATGRNECDGIIIKRTLQNEPLLLFSDIGSLENNDPCKMCIEEEYESTVVQLEAGATQMFQGLFAFATATGQADLAAQYEAILQGLDTQAVIDFYSYYVTRGLYVELGKEAYMQTNDLFQALLTGCDQNPAVDCPVTTEEEAEAALANHADHTFSSSTTSGFPLPFWQDDGEGYLFPFGGGSPVGGSGIDMSGTLFSSVAFLTSESPSLETYSALVLTDPVHAWFVAGITPMTGRKYYIALECKRFVTWGSQLLPLPLQTVETKT